MNQYSLTGMNVTSKLMRPKKVRIIKVSEQYQSKLYPS